MPAKKAPVPAYQHHMGRNLARVTINGRDIYLGPYDSPESKLRYAQVIADYVGGVLEKNTGTVIDELVLAYWKHCKSYYVKNGKPTDEQAGIKRILRRLTEGYGTLDVAAFGPKALKELRSAMVAADLSRKYINQNVSRLVSCFKWGVANELVPESTWRALTSVKGLRVGEEGVREKPPVSAVDDAVVSETLEHLPPVVADMVRLQRLTGMRPGEVRVLRPCDVDRAGDVWLYRPHTHKLEHRGKQRVVAIGPKAQSVLRPYLLREHDAYCFRRGDGKPHNRCTYSGAIARACKRHEIPHWHPNQLRHTAATEIRGRYGLEGGQVVLGHSHADTTQIYAETNLAEAVRIASQIG